MKKISILGSTGSIGTQTLDVVRRYPDKFKIVGLAAGRNVELLRRQAEEFKPEISWHIGHQADSLTFPPAKCPSEKEHLPTLQTGTLEDVATHPSADIVVAAIVGSAGLVPTLAAVRAGKTVALANKESLVCAGELVMHEAKNNNTKILPVDSEHYCISECLLGRNIAEVKRIILTASGGALFGKTRKELENVTPEIALNHPNWKMGAKITVDSATLMNKALEVIEAHHLFDVPFDKISVVVHRESIIHSMVEFVDGSMIAQLAMPDMRLPIQAALTFPDKIKGSIPRLNLAEIGKLTFAEPDLETFECLNLGIEAGRIGGTMPAVMNKANEKAVDLFLNKELSFLDIPKYIKEKMDAHKPLPNPSLGDILNAI